METKLDQQGIGIFSAFAAYLLWGVLPLYWKVLNHVPADEILAHRIIWSLFFMIASLLLFNKLPTLFNDLKTIFNEKKQLLYITVAALIISLNWFTYIWAVNNERLVEASLGYYINPLVSVVLGMLFFQERLTRAQFISFLLAAFGVVILTIYTGGIPIVSLVLALTFAFYGVLKKKVAVGALTGLTIETLIISPLAIFYLSFIHSSITNALYLHSFSTLSLLVGAGAATATPLLLFAISAKRIPLALVGFMQYIAPTITLLIGIFIFEERFSPIHILAFSFIWLALAIYSISKTLELTRARTFQYKKKSAS